MPTKLRFEKTLLGLLVLTVLAVVGQQWLLHETFIIEPSQRFSHRLYSDEVSGATHKSRSYRARVNNTSGAAIYAQSMPSLTVALKSV